MEREEPARAIFEILVEAISVAVKGYRETMHEFKLNHWNVWYSVESTKTPSQCGGQTALSSILQLHRLRAAGNHNQLCKDIRWSFFPSIDLDCILRVYFREVWRRTIVPVGVPVKHT
jgi:hypothetical protein